MTAVSKFTKPGADVRREQILAASLALAERFGFNNVRRDAVALEANVSQGLVNMYFGTMANLRNELMAHAVRVKNLQVVAQGLLDRHPEALKAPQSLRSLAAGQVFDA